MCQRPALFSGEEMKRVRVRFAWRVAAFAAILDVRFRPRGGKDRQYGESFGQVRAGRAAT